MGTLSAGAVRDLGLSSDLFPNGTSATYLDGSIDLAYDLAKEHSDYLLDYAASGRHYENTPQLDAITQDLGLRQGVELGPHTRWILDYRFSLTPDVAYTLLSESLAEQTSLLDPVSAASGNAGSALQEPILSPADGLLAIRSTQLTNSANASLTQELSLRTTLSFQAGYSRVRFQDPNLFGENQYAISTKLDHFLSARTSIGLSYQAGRIDLVSAFDRTTYQSVALVVTKQLGPRSVLTLESGPSLIRTRGQETTSLSSVVANLLNTSSLNRTSSSTIGWLGSAKLGTNISDVGVSLSYVRSVSGIGGLGGASLMQSGAVSMTHEIGRKTNISAGVSYSHYQLLGVVDPSPIDQEGLSVLLTRRVTRALECSTYLMYSKVLRGFHGPSLADHRFMGVSVTYNLRPEVPASGM